jgi:hypothetical protein
VTCPRCGRTQPPTGSPHAPSAGAARYCVHCGRVLTGVRWVASPPDAFRPRDAVPHRPHYAGPPAYRAIPRWSLWPWAAPVRAGGDEGPLSPPTAVPASDALRATAGLLRRLACTTAILAVVAALSEGWRYVLLLLSRSSALSAGPLAWSDALVTLSGLLTPVAALATGVVFLRWLVQARGLAADESGTEPARSDRSVVVGSVIPPLTLWVPGAALAEIEHAGSGHDRDARPRPSRTVAVWWGLWAGGVLLGLVTVLHTGDSTQALADGVVLHALVDVVAAATAIATVRVVEHLTELLAPRLREHGRAWVVRVDRSEAPA